MTFRIPVPAGRAPTLFTFLSLSLLHPKTSCTRNRDLDELCLSFPSSPLPNSRVRGGGAFLYLFAK